MNSCWCSRRGSSLRSSWAHFVRAHLALLGSLFGLLLLGCNSADFDPVSKIASVRILATQASKPYAKPGDEVSIRLLATDARPDAKSKPAMKLLWLAAPCENPFEDLYYGCYLNFARTYQPHVPLTFGELVPEDPANPFKITISPDIIARHAKVEGSAPFGTVFVFSMACAGDHVEYLGLRTSPSPQSVPFACVDAAGKALGPDDFVFAFTRIFVFEELTNENPVIDSVRIGDEKFQSSDFVNCGGEPALCPQKSIARCTKQHVGDCPTISVDTIVPTSSQERDPTSDRGKEQLWVDYYSTAGKFENDVRILYDVSVGRVSDTAVDYHTPNNQTDELQKIWAVVHDNRGGVEWLEIPVKIEQEAQ